MEETSGMKQKVISGMSWKLKEQILVQGLSQFILAPILARLLLPEEYGNVALVMVVINIVAVFVGAGCSDALIQKKDATDVDFSTMMLCSMGISLTLYAVIFFSAPWICRIYENPELIPIMRVLGLHLPLLSLNTIFRAYVSRKMMFRKFFFSTVSGTVVSGLIVVAMAFAGFGEWALVVQFLTNTFVDTLVLMFTVHWRPRLQFSLESAKKLFGFGSKLMLASFLNSIYLAIKDFVIGKVYSTADLAYYNKGNNLPSTLVTNLNNSMTGVLFPALSSTNQDKDKLRELTRRSIQTACYVIFPMMMGFFAVAETLITLWLSEVWIGCVPFLRICCLYWMIEPIKTANTQSVKACGRGGTYLKLEILKKGIGIILILLTMRISVMAVVASNLLLAIISTAINIYPNRKLISYGYFQQMKDILPSLCMSVVMAIAVWMEYFFLGTGWWVLILQCCTGVVIYVLLSVITRNKTFLFLLHTLLGDRLKKRK